ncbi:hypothetical protein Pint_14952 [Pistacia integerrima]|uniref:Uncharacterized protein n=1 Tax=Pistacia integerrima TaxID=434235 RepID=A0ACC0ZEJ6_9ROSI|nr:hypothetical protein Pint_14952 [Pistacia integerrima]
MRPPPSSVAAKNESPEYPVLSSTSTPTCNPHTCRWKPYSNSNNDFEANTILVLIILFCALTCALALNAAIRCFLRGSSQQRSPESSDRLSAHQRKPTIEVAETSLVAAPTLVYSAGMKLAGEEAECVICLSEFVEGDVIQVLERCKHGFHVQCIQQWLSSHHSCPTCRCTCLSSSPSSQQLIHHDSQLAVPQTGPSIL